MRALFLVLATGCASEAWQSDFSGDFRVTAYSVDEQACDATTDVFPRAPYVRFRKTFDGQALLWCDENGACEPYGVNLVATESGLQRLQLLGLYSFDVDPSLACATLYDDTRATRTTADTLEIVRTVHHLAEPYGDPCPTSTAEEVLIRGTCSHSERLEAVQEEAR